MGAGGVIIPPATYFAKINAVLAKYDVRYIADEVICGFGRTGDWFGTTTMLLLHWGRIASAKNRRPLFRAMLRVRHGIA